MAFKTAAEIFGNGGGFGPVVPYSTTNPPGTSAGNRGIQFGEQLTAAIANRTHYALALNDEDLNTRLASFEVGGLDAAYDNGTIGPAGGGRQITKDGGAVETISTLAASYADDLANAHLRCNSFGNVVRGGGGLDAAGWARGTTSPLYGLIDRRGLNFAGVTSIGDSVVVNLGVPDTVTITGAELFSTGGVTSLNPGYDLIEILSGVYAGLYVLSSVVSPTVCTVRRLDGTVPAFAASASTFRVCRALFGSFTSYGHSGTLGFVAPTLAGLPGTESAADFIASKNGRYDTIGLSPDASRYALRVLHPTGAGTLETKLTIDGHAQVRSAVSSTQQTAAQLAAAVDFGVAAFVAEPSGLLPPYEAGFVAKRGGATAAWFGFTAFDSAKPPTTPGGSFVFNFINVGALNVELTDTVAVDWNVSPTVTLVEITAPGANAGIYRVNAVSTPASGRLSLVTLAGAAPSFPLAGAGTLRILYGVSIGDRAYDVGTVLRAGWTDAGRTGLMVSSPKEVGAAALVLESGNRSASPGNYFLIRGMSTNTGATAEGFSVTADGDVSALTIEATGDIEAGGDLIAGTDAVATGNVVAGAQFFYNVAPARSIRLSPYKFNGDTFTTQAGDAQRGWLTLLGSGVQSQFDLAALWCDLAGILRSDCAITSIGVRVNPGNARAALSRFRVDLVSSLNTSAAVTTEASAEDNGTGAEQTFTVTPGAPVILDFATRSYYLVVTAGTDGGAHTADVFYGVTINFTDVGPRNF